MERPMPNPLRVIGEVEGHITSDIFHHITEGRVSDERLTELIQNEKILAYEINGRFIIDIGSIRRWLRTVHPITLEPFKDLFA
jgi:hypothetical protein